MKGLIISHDQQGCLNFTVDVISMQQRIRLVFFLVCNFESHGGGNCRIKKNMEVLFVPFRCIKKQFLVPLRVVCLKRSTAWAFAVPAPSSLSSTPLLRGLWVLTVFSVKLCFFPVWNIWIHCLFSFKVCCKRLCRNSFYGGKCDYFFSTCMDVCPDGEHYYKTRNRMNCFT